MPESVARARSRRTASCRAATLTLLGISCGMAGCGLSDYEKHIDEQAANLKYFDEENEVLGNPLEMPNKLIAQGKGKAEGEALRVKFFLRPPKYKLSDNKYYETADKVNDKEGPFSYGKVNLYRYAGPPGFNLLFTDAPLDVNPQTRLEMPDGISLRDFRKDVRGALMSFVQKNYRENPNWLEQDKVKAEPYSAKDVNGRPVKVEFDIQAFSTAPPGKEDVKYHYFEIAYNVSGPNQAAVIFDIPAPLAKEPIVAKTLEMSLRTLVLGQDAMNKRQAYVLQRKGKTRPQRFTPVYVP